MEFWLPKGMNRFHFVGGAKFFHGGAMLQEIVVPVITNRELWGKALQKSEISKVGVSLLGAHKKVVTNIHRFEFIQTDAVSERVRPRSLLISLRDGNDIFAPFPEDMIDAAFFDRMHSYLPGWEIPKMRPEYLTNQYGLIVDYLAEYLREMRKWNYSDAVDKYFKLGNNLNQRDVIAVRKTVSGMLKLLYPHGEFDKEAVERCLVYALENRRRVKEQLKKIGGMEFYDVHFSYIDNESLEERFVSVPEQGGGSLIPDGPMNPGTMHTVTPRGLKLEIGNWKFGGE